MDADRLLDALNDEQRRAVTCETTPLCILAGAGTGKTRVLTRRIAYRAAIGAHDPRHVLALTFTRKAAGELTSRLRVLGLRDRVAAGTFHSLAYAQLRTRWADQRVAPRQVLERKVGFVARLLPTAQRASALDVVTEIEWAKARDLDPDDYLAEVHQAGRRAPLAHRDMAAVYRRYEHEKHRRGLIDFDDLLRLCRAHLRDDPEFARSQHWRFQHLFVDEFQDVNPLQRSLLDTWLDGRSDLCVVGDPNQAIYGWNGADPSALADFAADHPGAEVVHLADNYRSSPQILAVANAVLAGAALEGGPRPDPASTLRANRPEGPLPDIVALPDDTAEATAVARRVRDRHPPGGTWSDQAVLCRTNAQLAVVEQALHAARIPFRVRGGAGLLDQPEVRTALRELERRRGDLAGALADLSRHAGSDGSTDDPSAAAGDDAGGDAAPDGHAANLEALARLGHDYLAVDGHPTPAGFVAWLRETTRAEQPDAEGDAVELTTFHAAKGLEWPVVHLAGLEQGLTPIGHAKSADELAEERRLFYVALTRAERELHLTWALARTFGERTSSRTRSPYLDLVEAATDALAAGRVPADWADHLARQRAALRTAGGGTARRGAGAARAAGGRDPRRRPADELAPHERAVFDALKDWRAQRARAADVPAYVVFHDRVLVELARSRPTTHAELLRIGGIGPAKVDRFGDEILGVLAGAPTS